MYSWCVDGDMFFYWYTRHGDTVNAIHHPTDPIWDSNTFVTICVSRRFKNCRSLATLGRETWKKNGFRFPKILWWIIIDDSCLQHVEAFSLRMPSQLFGNAWESHWLPTAAFRRIPCSLATQNWLWPILSILQSPIHIKHFHSMISMIPNYVISYSTRPWFLGVLNVKFHPPLTLECLGGVRQEIFEKYFAWPHDIYPLPCVFWLSKGVGVLRMPCFSLDMVWQTLSFSICICVYIYIYINRIM